MKTITILVALSFIFQYMEKSMKLSDNSIVKYNVDNSGNKQGAYIIQDKSRKIVLRGSYTNNIRTGDWYCFDKQERIILRYNYNIKKLIAFQDSQLSGISFKILDSVTDETAKTRAAIPIYPISELKALIAAETQAQMPSNLKGERNEIDAYITIFINKKGEARYEARYVVDSYQYNTRIFLDVKNFHIEWLPALIGEKEYKSEAFFKVHFRIDPLDSKRFLWKF